MFCLSVRSGGLCAQRGIRCLQRLDLGLDLPFEMPPPFGELGLAENFETILPVDQVARDGAQLLLSLVCFYALSRCLGCFSRIGLCLILLGILWSSAALCTVGILGGAAGDGGMSCSAWRKRASAALTCIYPRAAQPVSSAGRARENPLIPWFSGAALHLALARRTARDPTSLPA